MLDKIKADISAIHAKVALWEDEAKAEFERLKQEFLDLWIRGHGGEVPIENQLAAAQIAHDTVVAASNSVPEPKPVEPTEPPKPVELMELMEPPKSSEPEDKKPDEKKQEE